MRSERRKGIELSARRTGGPLTLALNRVIRNPGRSFFAGL